MSAPRRTLKTYSHLAGERRRPSHYDVATAQLLWHPTRGFAVDAPMADWYERHARGSLLQCSNPEAWERWQDPRQLTYTRWTEVRRDGETHVDRLLGAIDETGYDARLDEEWLALVAEVLFPLRFPVHGLEMVAGYVGTLAPSGRVAICLAFQAADELRRLQRIAQRMAQLRAARPSLADDSRGRWQGDPAWQPLRRTVEELLVAWDFGEALVAMALCVKPAFDHLAAHLLPSVAESHGDPLLAQVLRALGHDAAWHAEWSESLVRHALDERPANYEPVRAWVGRWRPRALAAVAPLAGRLGVDAAATQRFVDERLARLGVEASP